MTVPEVWTGTGDRYRDRLVERDLDRLLERGPLDLSRPRERDRDLEIERDRRLDRDLDLLRDLDRETRDQGREPLPLS